MRYQYQPKHLRELEGARLPLASRSLKSGVAAAAVTAALLPALLATPALAATQIGIDGSTYTEAAQGTGSNGGSWSWGGRDDSPLNLDGYNGGAISWQGGDLTINATGDNTVGAEDVTMTYSDPQMNNGEGITDTATLSYSIHESTADGGTQTTTYEGWDTSQNLPVGEPTVTVTDAKGNVVDPHGSLTITGGGTVATKAAVAPGGDIAVTGGTTLSAGATVGGRNVTVSGGSVLQTTYGYYSSDLNASLVADGDMTVSYSSVDVSSGKVVVAGKLTVTRSDFRCSDLLSIKELVLDGSEVTSGKPLDGQSDPSISSDYQNANWDHRDDPTYDWESPAALALSNAVVIAPTFDKTGGQSDGSAATGVLAVRQTPVPADNAPEPSDTDVYKTFIVSSVGKDDVTGTIKLNFSVGKEYAGKTATVYIQHEDGTKEVKENVLIDADGLAHVTTDRLSRFTVVIAGAKKPAASGTDTTTGTDTSTSTQATTAAAAAMPKAAPAKTAAVHASTAASETIPQTGDPFGATGTVLAALGALALFEAKHLRREA